MSLHGNVCQKFHSICDNVGPTLILIVANKNKIFGGFTPLSWKPEKNDEKEYSKLDEGNLTFIFSLNQMKKYDVDTINCCSISGPNFGNKGFGINEQMSSGFLFQTQNISFLDEKDEDSFEINEMEIFKVIY